jgi:hypothetical protein
MGATIKSLTYHFAVILISTLIPTITSAQVDTALVFNRNGVDVRFHLKKLERGVEFTPPRTYYLISENELNKVAGLLSNYIDLEANSDMLMVNQLTVDSLIMKQENQFKELIEKYEERIANCNRLSNELISINQRLNDTITDCEKLAKVEHKKVKSRGRVIIAAISLPLGILLGATLFR